MRAYEQAAIAMGRLDAAGSLATPGLREMLRLRCAAQYIADPMGGMIAQLVPDGERPNDVRAFADALRVGSARARGGTIPSLEMLRGLLPAASPGHEETSDDSSNAAVVRDELAIDELIGDVHVRSPALLKAVLTAGAILSFLPDRTALAALATTLVLCVEGATTDAWLTLPLATDSSLLAGPAGVAGWNEWLARAFITLGREAIAAERGLAKAHARLDADRENIRELLGRASYSAIDVLALLADQLVTTIPDAARALGQTSPTTGAAMARLVELGIVREVTGRARSRAFVYAALLDTMTA